MRINKIMNWWLLRSKTLTGRGTKSEKWLKVFVRTFKKEFKSRYFFLFLSLHYFKYQLIIREDEYERTLET